jgi:O-antigen ligase
MGIKTAFQHPVFGIGQGQFANYEGKTSRVVRGIRGEYQEVHNSYIAAASECGIPAFLFFVAGILSSFRLVNSVFRQARRRPECQDIKTATFCIMLAMVGFYVCVAFLNFTYFFYFPAIAGISVAVYYAAQQEFRLRGVEPSGAWIVENPNWMPANGAFTGRQITYESAAGAPPHRSVAP